MAVQKTSTLVADAGAPAYCGSHPSWGRSARCARAASESLSPRGFPGARAPRRAACPVRARRASKPVTARTNADHHRARVQFAERHPGASLAPAQRHGRPASPCAIRLAASAARAPRVVRPWLHRLDEPDSLRRVDRPAFLHRAPAIAPTDHLPHAAASVEPRRRLVHCRMHRRQRAEKSRLSARTLVQPRARETAAVRVSRPARQWLPAAPPDFARPSRQPLPCAPACRALPHRSALPSRPAGRCGRGI